MKLKDYILGRRVTMTSTFDQAEVSRRIREGSGSLANPFSGGVKGWYRFGMLRLWWATPMWSNGFAPILSAKLDGELGGTRLNGRFGAPTMLLVFLVIWYSMLFLFLTSSVSAYVGNPGARSENLLGLAVGLAMMLVPVMAHLVFNRRSHEHLEAILKFLSAEAGFSEAPTST